jgi:hypothetical protein
VVLTEQRPGLDLVARALLEHETIDGEEVYRLVELGQQGRTAVEEFGEWHAKDGRGEGSGAFAGAEEGAVAHAASRPATKPRKPR